MDPVRESRDFIEYPSWLKSTERGAWDYLNAHYAPLIVTDAFGASQHAAIPPLRECGWWSIYATALMCLAPDRVNAEDQEPIDKPFLAGFRTEIIETFWKQRQARLLKFRNFLDRWHLASLFGLHSTPTYQARSAGDMLDGEDECVLWFHSFSEVGQVQDYALRWSTNPHFISPVLTAHRLVISRGIDLICSELLANAFEHSGGARCFILAKLCSLASARAALASHRHGNVLTVFERAMYDFCIRHQCPTLQLVIADEGTGFAGNEVLCDHYRASRSDSFGAIQESDLIAYALRPDVSTKAPNQVMSAWAELMSDADAYTPVVHGLSEVRLFVEENCGSWRIHSNDTLVDIDGASRAIEYGKGRDAQGCVHYIQLPLISDTNAHGFRSLSFNKKSRVSSLIPLDIADEADPGEESGQASTAWAQRVLSFRQKLLNRSTEPDIAFVVNLLSLDDMPLLNQDADRAAACALIADALHRVRSGVGVFLIASEATRSLLRRFKNAPRLFDRRVLPYLNILTNHRAVTIDCSDELRPIEQILLEALDPWSEHSVLRSHHGQHWGLLEQVHHHNQGLFEFVSLAGGDVAFEGRVKAGVDVDSGHLLLGTREFSFVADLLRSSEGFLPWDERRPYWFRSTNRTTHLNLGRLLANERFKTDLIAWFAAAVKSLAYEKSTKPDAFVFVALLHPAIGITQELLRTRFPKAELIEISNLADVSADSWQILNVVERDVVCVADMVVTGETMSQLVHAIEYAGGRVAGALSLLALRGYAVRVPLFSFSECTQGQLKHWADRPGSSDHTQFPEPRIVDANSQFTERVSGDLKPLEKRALLLLEHNSLLFAHRVFGRHHHTFPILVRNLLERGLTIEVLRDIERYITEFFGSDAFVVLYPGESTISYILRQNEAVLPPDRCFALVPTFSSYGVQRLRIDRYRNKELDDQNGVNHVLFLDDSLSSGMTERLAMEAWQLETKQRPTTWVTYVIVRRGAHVSESTRLYDRGRSAGTLGTKFYRQRQYCSIGPRSFSVGDCPFCMGLERLKVASRLAMPLHNRASTMLKELVDSFKAMPVEGHGATSLLESDDAAEFLMLATNPMWESAYHLGRHAQPVSAGRALFVAFFAGDLSAYLSTASIAGLLAEFAAGIGPDDAVASRHLLAALAVLPLSYSQAVITPIVQSLLRSANTAPALAGIALLIAQTGAVLTQFEAAGMSLVDRNIRSGTLLQNLESAVDGVAAERPAIAPAVRVMQLEMRAMASPSGTASIVQLARTLSALFYDGAHNTLLLPQLDQLTPESLSRVGQQLMNALAHLESFAAVSDVQVGRVLVGVRDLLQAAADRADCERFKEQAVLVMEHWKGLRGQYFHSTWQLGQEATRGLTIALEAYMDIPGSYRWFDVDPVPSSLKGWHVLGPDARYLREHFANVFTNTIKHAQSSYTVSAIMDVAKDGSKGCIGRMSWEPDEINRELVITYSQTIPYKKPSTTEGRGMMANSNALLSAFGGSIRLAEEGPARTGDVRLTDPVTVCQTRMPLVLEVPR